ncbi:AI-2E family transporter [Arsenicitalea aurantiaca]|nr:AI-2E family transporter [Arsenicitalea aurantiaca]
MSETHFERVLGNASRIALVLIGAVVLLATLQMGQMFLAPIALSIVIGLMFGPVADMIERHGVPAGVSAAVLVLLFLVMIATFVMAFAMPLSGWIDSLPVIWEKLRSELMNLRAPLEALSGIEEQVKSIFGNSQGMTVSVEDSSPMRDLAMLAPTYLAQIGIFLVSLYFFLATRNAIRLSVLSLCFSRRLRWRVAHVFRDVEQQVSRFLITVSLINLGFGIIVTIAMYAVGMPSPILWGVLGAILNFIPYVGQVIMLTILFAVSIGTQDGWFAILLPIVVYSLINFTESQFVTPHFMGRALTLNPFIIFLSLTFWIWAWGPVGGLVAVPSLLIMQAIITHIIPVRREISAVHQRVNAKTAQDVVAAESTSPCDTDPIVPPAEFDRGATREPGPRGAAPAR